MTLSKRPWGTYEILLDESSFKLKKIVVNPLQRLSYQSHELRDEVWVVVSGSGLVTIDDKINEIGYNSIICIPKKSKHRIENNKKDEKLVFIEIQTGSSFEEEDIVRYEDDYGRNES